MGLVPIVPETGLRPDLVLLIFLPPLLYSAAFFSSPCGARVRALRDGDRSRCGVGDLARATLDRGPSHRDYRHTLHALRGLPARLLSRSIRERNPSPPWQQVAAIAYTGMRGAISLAAALAIPLSIQDGAPFPGRTAPALRRPRQRGRRLRRTLPSVPAFQAGVARCRACGAPPAQGRRPHQRRGKTTRREGPRPRRSAAGDLTAARMTPAYRARVAEQVAESQPDRLRRTASTNVC